jgi:hypothetical protein
MITFDVSKGDVMLIAQITRRAVTIAQGYGVELDFLSLEMDITACHANGCPLDLGALLASSELDFQHDVLGIRRHIDRETGQLTDCFVPRCAKREDADL